ncbi:DUF58 domain-containing protein [Haliangium sp.]|uniref:DUF58 domain-containing protein n=1 Tax=Haliangium sp. TaxID=2663208 RepID=UPI003D0B541B
MPFLDPSALAQIDGMPLRARIVVEGALTGMHRARLRGSSVEFAEHKEYAPGDEIRHIDWKTYAKVDRYYVKQFEQESQLMAHLVLDASASMDFRSDGPSKLSYASYLVAALAYLLIRQRDRVGLHVFGDPDRGHYVPPRARPAHLSDLLAVLEEVEREGGRGAEPAGLALDRVAEQAGRRRALVVVVSDLLEPEPGSLGALPRLAARGHDVVVFHLLDPYELELPYRGLTHFVGLEDERRLIVDPEAVRKRYLSALAHFLDRAERTCLDAGVIYHRVRTDQPVERTLLDFLATRLRAAPAPRSWSS